jgi:hypothetical protein
MPAKQVRLPVEYLFAVSLVNLIFATHKKIGPVAQLNRVFDYGSKGSRFESWRGH